MSVFKGNSTVKLAMLNFCLLALLGAILRYMISFSIPVFDYKNILHAHSHFAFSGWVFLAFVIVFAKQYPSQKSFKWIFILTLLCSFGMLISFSIQGYKLISIVISTAFLFVTYWFAYLVLTEIKHSEHILYRRLMSSSIWFLILSSAGPFALGIFKALGFSGVMYQNAIYFYLHFQLNGWMLLAVLGLIAHEFVKAKYYPQIAIWLNIFIISSIPLFLIFTLWVKPPPYIFLLAFLCAFINAYSYFFMWFKLYKLKVELPFLIKFAVIAIAFKVIFQVLVCMPQIASWVFLNRNLIIGYLHLITLGCISPVLLNQLISKNISINRLHKGYVVLTFAYVFFLFLQPFLNLFAISIPYYQDLLLMISILFVAVAWFYYHAVKQVSF